MNKQKDFFEVHTFANELLPFIYHYDINKKNVYRHSNWHDNPEILYFVKGEGEILIDSQKYKAMPNDIFIINSNNIHRIDTNSKVEFHCFIFDVSFFEENGINLNNISFENKFNDDKLAKCLLQFSEDFKEKIFDKYYTPIIRKDALEIVINIAENHSTITKKSEKKNVGEIVKNGLAYINANFDEPITLEDITREINISKFYFSREFKTYTGLTVVSYINFLRFKKAKKMLTNTNISISKIATDCGFENMSYFSKQFKKSVGILPSEYRKKQQ